MTDAGADPGGRSTELVDQLVPAVDHRRHRAVILAAVLLGAAAVSAAVTGWIVPLTDGPELRQWGGTGPVYAVVHVANDSPRDIEITRMGGVADGLSVVGYTTEATETWDGSFPTVGSDVFPVRLDPGEGADITVVYRIEDCTAASQSDDVPSVEVRFPGPTGLWERTRKAAWLDATPWPTSLTELACPT